VAKAELNN